MYHHVHEALFTTLKTRKQRKCSSTNKRIKSCDKYIQCNNTQPCKRVISCHFQQNRNRLRYREHTCSCQGRGQGRMDWKVGVNRCKVLYIQWINNKVLLYCTEKLIQYPVINHNGKEYEKECICMYNSITFL